MHDYYSLLISHLAVVLPTTFDAIFTDFSMADNECCSWIPEVQARSAKIAKQLQVPAQTAWYM